MTKKELRVNIAKLYAELYHIGNVAKVLGLTRSQVMFAIRDDEKLALMICDIKQDKIDNAEAALDKLVDKDNFKAIEFTLKTRGRDRGYDVQSSHFDHGIARYMQPPTQDQVDKAEKDYSTKVKGINGSIL